MSQNRDKSTVTGSFERISVSGAEKYFPGARKCKNVRLRGLPNTLELNWARFAIIGDPYFLAWRKV